MGIFSSQYQYTVKQPGEEEKGTVLTTFGILFDLIPNNQNYQNEKCAVPDLTSILPPQKGLEFTGGLGLL